MARRPHRPAAPLSARIAGEILRFCIGSWQRAAISFGIVALVFAWGALNPLQVQNGLVIVFRLVLFVIIVGIGIRVLVRGFR